MCYHCFLISCIQSIKKKPIVPNFGSTLSGTHTTDLPSLQKVMTIKAVPLQQRLPSSTLPHANLFSTRLQNELVIHFWGLSISYCMCLHTKYCFYKILCDSMFCTFLLVYVYVQHYNNTVNLFF